MAPSEEWRRASGLAGYEVSSLGNVRRAGSKRLRKLKLCKRGYLWLSVANGRGSARNLSVARLVCATFHGEPAPGLDSDHINRRRDDNRAENLRWCTRTENLAHRQCAFGSAHWKHKLTEMDVRIIRTSPLSNTALASQIGVARRTVADARNGTSWRHIDV